MKRLSFSNLRVHLILLVLIAALPAWGLMLYTDVRQRERSAAEVQDHACRMANLAAREEKRLIDDIRQILITLAQFIRYDRSDPARCSTFFADLLKQYRRYTNFGAIKPDGDPLCSAVHLKHPINAAGRLWFNRAMETRGVAIAHDETGGITGEPALVFAYPVVDTTGQMLAVVFAALDLKRLNRLEFDAEKQLPKAATLTMVDNKGVILARWPDSEKWVGRLIPDTNFIKVVLTQKKGLIEAADPDGVQWFYAFTPVHTALNSTDVYLILGIPKGVAFAYSDRLLTLNLIGLGIVVLLALIVAWFGSDLFVLRRVRAMASASRRLADGDLSARTGVPYGSGELGQLACAFDEMAATLEQRKTEEKRAEEKIKRSREQLRNLSAHLQTVREEEKTRIAREMHDDLGQVLTALKMDLSWLSKRSSGDQESILGKIESMSTLIDQAIQRVHTLSAELRPGILDDFGLLAAIEWQAEEFQNRAGIKCKVAADSQEVDLDKGQSTTIFRIFQETLTNIVRHANATKIEVSLEEKDGNVVLKVKDNGRGITEEEISDPKSFGLIGMRERVRPWDGEVNIVGVQDRGTQVTASMTLDKKGRFS